jgi:hypothetical protein
MKRKALVILLASLSAAAAGQNAVPETPPELRDFRLDEPPAQPTPRPEAEVEPPPAVPTVQPEARPATPPPAARERTPPSPMPVRAPASDEELPQAVTEDVTSENVTATPSVSTNVDGSPTPSLPAAPVADEGDETGALPWLWIFAILAALAALVGALLWRKKRPQEVIETAQPTEAPKSAPATPVVTPAAPEPATLVPADRPRMAIEFIPERATLGFSALTLKGQLRLTNSGTVPAREMALRTTMISANHRQREIVAAFQGGAIPIQPNMLGEAQAGERLALEIEMALPISEMESFVVNERRIFVPVLLANLSYTWDGGKDEVTLACIVGREHDPANPRLGPFRIDRGPRSFSPLGQRPLAA